MILRRLRGIAVTALLWGVPWSLILGTVAAGAVWVLQVRIGPLRAFTSGAATGFYWGAAAGALFGSALMLAEQNRGFAGLTRRRGILWGAVAGVWFPALMGLAFGPDSLPMMVAGSLVYLATAAMGALSGFVTLWIAEKGNLSAGPLSSGRVDRTLEADTGGHVLPDSDRIEHPEALMSRSIRSHDLPRSREVHEAITEGESNGTTI